MSTCMSTCHVNSFGSFQEMSEKKGRRDGQQMGGLKNGGIVAYSWYVVDELDCPGQRRKWLKLVGLGRHVICTLNLL